MFTALCSDLALQLCLLLRPTVRRKLSGSPQSYYNEDRRRKSFGNFRPAAHTNLTRVTCNQRISTIDTESTFQLIFTCTSFIYCLWLSKQSFNRRTDLNQGSDTWVQKGTTTKNAKTHPKRNWIILFSNMFYYFEVLKLISKTLVGIFDILKYCFTTNDLDKLKDTDSCF